MVDRVRGRLHSIQIPCITFKYGNDDGQQIYLLGIRGIKLRQAFLPSNGFYQEYGIALNDTNNNSLPKIEIKHSYSYKYKYCQTIFCTNKQTNKYCSISKMFYGKMHSFTRPIQIKKICYSIIDKKILAQKLNKIWFTRGRRFFDRTLLEILE